MDLTTNNCINLKNLNKVNVLLGRNGSGKSNLLRDIDLTYRSSQSNGTGKVSYITPERGGTLSRIPNLDTQFGSSAGNAVSDSRSKNQYDQFKQQTISQFIRLMSISADKLEKLVKDKVSNDELIKHLRQGHVDKINSLLDYVSFNFENNEVRFKNKKSAIPIDSPVLSSGESELVTLGIECISFFEESNESLLNVLLLDEPDVHLHPDLQIRFVNFLNDLINSYSGSFLVIISTHSTPLVQGLAEYDYVNIGFIKDIEQKEIQFNRIDEYYKDIIPIFGAHPLTQVFNKTPIFLIEGEDDLRIWQQAIRTSKGEIKIYPCVCDNKDEIDHYEKRIKSILPSIYDKPKAYSLRDRDDINGEIQDDEFIIKFKLECYSAENLLLANEVLTYLKTSWEDVKAKITNWLNDNKNNEKEYYQHLKDFKEKGYDRKNFKLKEIRNILQSIITDSQKPWEVIVGQVIAQKNLWINNNEEDSLRNYLSNKLVENILV